MRVQVRVQLCLLILVCSKIPCSVANAITYALGAFSLAVLALATWFVQHTFVLHVATENLETAASLKAVDLAVSIDLIYTSSLYLTASVVLQEALEFYNNGSDTSENNWTAAVAVLSAALSAVGPLSHAPAIQSQLFSRNTSGPLGSASVLNVTGVGADITLPWENTNGAPARLGEPNTGYPPALYPNLTVDGTSGSFVASYNGIVIVPSSGLFLGPLIVNSTLSLMSLTIPLVRVLAVARPFVLTLHASGSGWQLSAERLGLDNDRSRRETDPKGY
jgi:osomolarity two-component system sensor histidine kinase SLN1